MCEDDDDDDVFSVLLTLLTLSTSGAFLSFIFWRSFFAGRGDLVRILSTIRRGDLFLLLNSPFDFGDLLLLLLLSEFDLGDLLLLFLLSSSGFVDLLTLFLSPLVFGDLLLFLSTNRLDPGDGDRLERLHPMGAGERLLLISSCLDSLFCFCLVFASLDFDIFDAFEESTDICDGGLNSDFRLFGLFLVGVGGSNISGFGAPGL